MKFSVIGLLALLFSRRFSASVARVMREASLPLISPSTTASPSLLLAFLTMCFSLQASGQLDFDTDGDKFPDDVIVITYAGSGTAGAGNTLRTRWDLGHPQGDNILDFRKTIEGWSFSPTTSRYAWEELGYPYTELGLAVALLLNDVGARYQTGDFRNQKLLNDYFGRKYNLFEFVDSFPTDPSEWYDEDFDGVGNNADPDDDGDGVGDAEDVSPLDPSEWTDPNGDSTGDDVPLYSDTYFDTDGDKFPDDVIVITYAGSGTAGAGNTLRTRWDLGHPQGDNILDFRKTIEGWSFSPTTSRYAWEELGYPYTELGLAVALLLNDVGARYQTGDFRNQKLLNDYFGRKYNLFEFVDSFPTDPSEWYDEDFDGVGNNADPDDDGDGVGDAEDVSPLDPSEWTDPNGDSTGDEAAYGIRAFTERFYTVVLGRDPDQGGLDNWVVALTGRTLTGSDLAKGFFLSPEYTNKQKSDSAFLDDCYQAYFDRAADAGGKQGWLDLLEQGMSRTEVLDGFSGSQEFIAVAESYGIRPFAGY